MIPKKEKESAAKVLEPKLKELDLKSNSSVSNFNVKVSSAYFNNFVIGSVWSLERRARKN